MNVIIRVLLRFCLYTIGGVFALAGIAMIASQIPAVKNYTLNYIINKVHEETQYDLSVKKLGGVFPFYITLDGIELKNNNSTIIEAEKVKLVYSPIDLLWSKVAVPFVSLKGVQMGNQNLDIEGRVDYKFRKRKAWGSVIVSSESSTSAPLHVTFDALAHDETFYLKTDISQRPELLAQGNIILNKDFSIQDAHLFINFFDLKLLPSSLVRGKLKGVVTATGTLFDPTFDVSLIGSELKVGKNRVSNIVLSALINCENGTFSGPLVFEGHLGSHPMFASVNLGSKDNNLIHFDNINANVGSLNLYGNLIASLKNKTINGVVEGEGEHFYALSELTGSSLDGAFGCKLAFESDEQDKQEIEFRGEIIDFKGDAWSIGGLKLYGSCSDAFGDYQGSAALSVNSLSNGSMSWNSTTFDTVFKNDQDKWPFSFSTSGNWYGDVHLTASGGWKIANESFDLSLDLFSGEGGQYPIALIDPIKFHADDDQVTLTPLHIKVGQGDLFARMDTTDAHLDGTVRANNIPLEIISSALYPDLPATGTLTATGSIEGSPGDVEGRVKIHVNDALIHDRAFAKIPPMRGSLNCSLKGGTLYSSVDMRAGELEPLRGLCTIPARLALSPFHFDLNWFLPVHGHLDLEGDVTHLLQLVVANTTSVTGYVKGHLDLTGTLAKPKLRAHGNLIDGTFESLNTGAVMRNIQASVEAKEDLLSLKTLEATVGKSGKITASGKMLLDAEERFPFELMADITSAELIRLDYANATASGRIEFKGDADRGSIQGAMSLDQGTAKIPEELPVPLKTVDVTYINCKHKSHKVQAPKEPKESWPTELNITLSIPGKAFVTGRNLTSEWQGEVTFSGTTAAPKLYGSLKMIDGEYLLNGRAFHGSSGTISFNGDPQKKASIYASVERDIEDIKAQAIVRGSLGNPEIAFRSNPPLPEKEILSWILFNRGISDIDQNQQTELSHTQFTLSAGRDETDMLSRIRSGIGIDRIDISNMESHNTKEVSVRVGKYLSPRVFVSLNKSINSDRIQTAVEGKLGKNFKMQAEVGDHREHRVSLKWEKDY